MSNDAPPEVNEDGVVYEPHVGVTRQYWRDIILGVNDGLVSVFLLVAGVVGGGLDSDQVLLTALAGAIAGAISMAAGEYLATQSQEEVFDREIALERIHIQHFRDGEVEQSNFPEYQPLRLTDMPVVEVTIVSSNEAPSGVGEPGVPPTGPAVANAIFAKTGQRIMQLPMTKSGFQFV